jgi:hypothetical protein
VDWGGGRGERRAHKIRPGRANDAMDDYERCASGAVNGRARGDVQWRQARSGPHDARDAARASITARKAKQQPFLPTWLLLACLHAARLGKKNEAARPPIKSSVRGF